MATSTAGKRPVSGSGSLTVVSAVIVSGRGPMVAVRGVSVTCAVGSVCSEATTPITATVTTAPTAATTRRLTRRAAGTVSRSSRRRRSPPPRLLPRGPVPWVPVPCRRAPGQPPPPRPWADPARPPRPPWRAPGRPGWRWRGQSPRAAASRFSSLKLMRPVAMRDPVGTTKTTCSSVALRSRATASVISSSLSRYQTAIRGSLP